jgi:hypothetical protein
MSTLNLPEPTAACTQSINKISNLTACLEITA